MPTRFPPGKQEPDKEADAELDIAEADSFPASDPPSITDPAKTIRTPPKPPS
jgi:hypothetical protein